MNQGLDFGYTYHGRFPDKLKIKKKLNIWPLEFSGTGVYDVSTGVFSHRWSCKDKLLGGKLGFHASQGNPTIEYRKLFALPFLAVRNLLCIVTTAHWDLDSPALKPKLGFELSFQEGNATRVFGERGWAVRRKLFVTNNLGLEVRGNLDLKLPGSLHRTAQHQLQQQQRQQEQQLQGQAQDGLLDAAPLQQAIVVADPTRNVAIPRDAFRLDAEVKELNLVLRL